MRRSHRKLRGPVIVGCLMSICGACDGDPVSADPSNGAPAPDSLVLELLWEHETPLQTFTALHDRQGRPFFYVANRSGGLLVFDASNPSAPQLVRTVPAVDFGSRFTNNLFQQGTLLYVAVGNFLGFPQQRPGLAVVDVSDPPDAAVVGIWEHASGTRGAHVVEVLGGHAFLGASFEGLIILDVTDPSDILLVSHLVPDVDFPRPDPGPLQRPAARGLTVVDDGLLALAYDAGGLRLIDIRDRQNPVEVGRHANPAIDPNVQAQAYNNVVARGGVAYVAVDYCGVEVVDIADPSDPRQLGWWDPWDCEGDPLNWFTSPGHTNELLLPPARDLLFVAAGDMELVVLDVSDPADPTLAASHGAEGNDRVAWGLDVRDSHVVLAHIRSPGGPFTSSWSGVALLFYE